MPAFSLVDLDQRPDLLPDVLALFSAHGPGRDHAVCGIPARMGLTPTGDDLRRCLGVLVAVRERPTAALAACAYSPEQVTLWGPVATSEAELRELGPVLFASLRPALAEGGFESLRALADTRNRSLRAFLLSQGMAAWKDDHLYERSLEGRLPADLGGVRRAQRKDHAAVAEILTESFAESEHCSPSLLARERDGYRHYLLEDQGTALAAAALQDGGRRSWIKLVAVRGDQRGRAAGKRLMAGLLQAEAKLGYRSIGLEVLADNAAAIALWEGQGFRRSWTASILTGPS